MSIWNMMTNLADALLERRIFTGQGDCFFTIWTAPLRNGRKQNNIS